MKITDIRATTITVPLEAPLRHANGCHWGRFVRTIVEEGPARVAELIELGMHFSEREDPRHLGGAPGGRGSPGVMFPISWVGRVGKEWRS